MKNRKEERKYLISGIVAFSIGLIGFVFLGYVMFGCTSRQVFQDEPVLFTIVESDDPTPVPEFTLSETREDHLWRFYFDGNNPTIKGYRWQEHCY